MVPVPEVGELLTAVVESMGDAVLVADASARLIVVNETARRLLPHAIVGQPIPIDWPSLAHARDAAGEPLPERSGPLWSTLDGESVDARELSIEVDGRVVWVEATGRPIRDASGAVSCAVVVLRDVTQRKMLTDRYRVLAENIPSGVVVLFDADLVCTALDGGLVRDFAQGEVVDEVVGKPLPSLAEPDGASLAFNALLVACRAALDGDTNHLDLPRDGRVFAVQVEPVRDPSGRVNGGMILAIDRTGERDTETELRAAYDRLAVQRSLLEATLESITEGVVLLDADRRLILCNQAYREMFQLSGDITGMTREEFIERTAPLAEDPAAYVARLRSEAELPDSEYVLDLPRRRVLRRRWTDVPDGAFGRHVVAWHDVTAETELRAERERLLRTDLLTGIANRRAAEEALAREAARSRRTGTSFCIALMDVDHFKAINDNHGHAAGDQTLRRIAGILRAEARQVDTVARWGGEEFLAVLTNPLEGARQYCERIRAGVADLELEHGRRVTISVGVVQVDPDADTAQALAQADKLLYRAKAEGRDRVIG